MREYNAKITQDSITATADNLGAKAGAKVKLKLFQSEHITAETSKEMLAVYDVSSGFVGDYVASGGCQNSGHQQRSRSRPLSLLSGKERESQQENRDVEYEDDFE